VKDAVFEQEKDWMFRRLRPLNMTERRLFRCTEVLVSGYIYTVNVISSVRNKIEPLILLQQNAKIVRKDKK
jgi:hypothetical protein